MAVGLRQRVLTAAILIPLVVGGLIVLPTPVIAIAFGAVALAGAHEWSVLAGLLLPAQKLIYLLIMAVTLTAFYPLLPQSGVLMVLVLLIAAGAWAAASARLVDYQRGGHGLPENPVLIGGLGVAALLCAWIALCGLHARPSQGPYWVIFLMVLIWTADIAAYFAGRRWGHGRLADRLSPGKTWAGVWGALVASLLVAMLGLKLFGVAGLRYYVFLAVAIATVLFSIVGDLFESLLKRKAGVKDSGSLLPGHGGILDRIDSLLAASPIFAAGVMILEQSA